MTMRRPSQELEQQLQAELNLASGTDRVGNRSGTAHAVAGSSRKNTGSGFAEIGSVKQVETLGPEL